MERYPILFPYREVNETTDPADLAVHVSRTFDHSGLVELVLNGRSSRAKFLYMLARLTRREKVSAQIAPRRRDSRARALITKGAFVSDIDDFEVVKVSARTDPAKLAESMRFALFGKYRDDPVRSNVEMRVVGPGSATVAMFALEQLRFDSWRDIRFSARFAQFGDVEDAKAVGVVVTLGVCSSEAQAPQGDDGEAQDESEGTSAEEEEEDDSESITSLPQVRWAPALSPDVFPTLFVGEKTGSMRLGTKLAASLSVCATRIVEVLVLEKAARSVLLYTIAALPPWLEAVAQIAPRRADSRCRFRVVKDYPLRGEPAGSMLRVSAATEPKKLAMALFARLLDRDDPQEAVDVQLIGPEAAARALLSLEHFQATSKREVSFRPRFEVMREDGKDVVRGIVLTVVAT